MHNSRAVVQQQEQQHRDLSHDGDIWQKSVLQNAEQQLREDVEAAKTLRALEKEMEELSEITRLLGTMSQEQQETIDFIEKVAEKTNIDTHETTVELEDLSRKNKKQAVRGAVLGGILGGIVCGGPAGVMVGAKIGAASAAAGLCGGAVIGRKTAGV
jgi:hypothetical protein